MAIHNNYITIAKAIGIILMVTGHSVCPELLTRFIYLFHMPLFFFCSGLFFTNPKKFEDLCSFIGRKIKVLYIPFITWNTLFLVFHNCFLYSNIYYHEETYIYHICDYIKKLTNIIFTMSDQEPILFQLWFLKQLLLSSTITYIFSYILYISNIHKNRISLLCILIAITLLTKRLHIFIPIIGDISLPFLGATFFYLGFLYKQFDNRIQYNTIIGWLCFFILILITGLSNSKIEMLNYSYKNIFLYICSALIGIYMVFCFAIYLEKYTIRKILYYIGNHTMVILIWHLVAFRLASLIKATILGCPIDYNLIAEHNEIFWIVYTIIGLGIPLLSTLIISKYVTALFRNYL